MATPASSSISPELVRMAQRMRFNPIRTLTPAVLGANLDSFATGYLNAFALVAQAIKRRDDVISVALPKREKAVSRRSYAVHLNDGLDLEDAAVKQRAEAHRDALKYFYDHLTAVNALDRNERGGFRLLARQMMEAVGFRYAVHEIVWQPREVDGQARLTAEFNYVPLQFFENTTGQLRFCPNMYESEGKPMEPDNWLVTVGDGIMEPLSVAYMFKQLSLRDWVSYNEKFGTPGVLGKTSASKDSPEWQAVADAVAAFTQDFGAVVNEGSTLELIETKGAAAMPFAPLVDRMDRAIATICRGADLSTMSAGAGSGQGASLQGDESALLEQDDAQLVTESLQHPSRIVIRELFGDEAPLAYVQIVVPNKRDAQQMRENTKLLVDMGGKVSAKWAHDEFGVPAASEKDDLLVKPATAPANPFGAGPLAALANSAAMDAAHREASRRAILKAKADAFAGLKARLEEAVAMTDETAQAAALAKIKADLPRIAQVGGTTEAEVAAWIEALATKLVSGAAEAAAEQAQKAAKP